MRRRSCGRPSTLGEQAARFFRPGARSDNRRALPAQSAARARDDRHRWAHRARNCRADRRPCRVAVVPAASRPRHRPRPDDLVPRGRIHRRDLPQRRRGRRGITSRRIRPQQRFAWEPPSFTIMSSRCTHVGCPTQPNGPIFGTQRRSAHTASGEVGLVPTQPAGFGCPCHGSQFDTEGNRTAGPAPRALDRYEFSIRDGHLWLGRLYSVSRVRGTGAEARIHGSALQGAGQPLTGAESWFYPIAPR